MEKLHVKTKNLFTNISSERKNRDTIMCRITILTMTYQMCNVANWLVWDSEIPTPVKIHPYHKSIYSFFLFFF